MMAEIAARGPIAATIAVPPALENYTGGIFNDTTGAMGLDHEIEIVGYGSENGVPYWLCRNRYGLQLKPSSLCSKRRPTERCL